MIADGNCYYRALGYAYLERLLILGAPCIKDLRDHIASKSGYYACEGGPVVPILVGHLHQLYVKLKKEGLERALQLLFKMMIFAGNLDKVSSSLDSS